MKPMDVIVYCSRARVVDNGMKIMTKLHASDDYSLWDMITNDNSYHHKENQTYY